MLARSQHFPQQKEYREGNEQLFTKCVVSKSAETCGVRLVMYAL